MAQTKYEKLMNDFKADIAEKALAKLNRDEIATQLATQLKKSIAYDTKIALERKMKIGDMIIADLRNTNTKIGRNFQGALDEISSNMIASLTKSNDK